MRIAAYIAKHQFVSVAAAVIVLVISASSCNRKAENSTQPDDDIAPTNSTRRPVDAATAGSLTGIVKFEGASRKMRGINMAAVPNCAKMHSSPATMEDVVLGDNHTLKNVVVFLKGDFGQYSFNVAKPAIRMDQSGCVYSPRVLALMTGQPLQMTNSDQTAHNVNAAPKMNRRWNESQPAGASPVEEIFAHAELAIPIKCNVHPWMKAYISVFSNPYFQVTGEDGSFRLSNVPPGKYHLIAWQEFYGTKEESVTIEAKQEKTVMLTFTDRDHK